MLQIENPATIRGAGLIVTTPWSDRVSSLSLASLRLIRPWMIGDGYTLPLQVRAEYPRSRNVV